MPVPRQPNSIGQRLPPPRTIGGGYKQPGINSLSQGIERMSVTQLGFNKLWVSIKYGIKNNLLVKVNDAIFGF